MSVDVGSKAPDFTLPNQERQPVALSSFAGKNVVLAFFPAAFTSVCQKELCYFRDHLAELNGVNAVVLGISTDTPFTLKEFAKQNALTFDLLSDFNKDVVQKYDVANPDMLGLKNISKRAVFVLDKTGTIKHREVTASPGDEPNYQNVHDTLTSLN
jgi:glutaredoxin-dependent peroxiredoxin